MDVNVSSRCRYQQQRSDTGQLGVVKDLRHHCSLTTRWQLGRCLAFRQSTWEWHVQKRNVTTREQEDDLAHTGQTFLPRQAHLNATVPQAQGTSRASSPWIDLKCYSYKGLGADVTSGPALTLVLYQQVFAFWRTGQFASQLGGWHESCQ